MAFLREKEGLLPENVNRSILIELLREHDMRCMNTRTLRNPVTRKSLIGTCGHQACKDHTDRYSELDLCLVFGRWANSIMDIESDSLTNVNTDHLALKVKMKQKRKALVEAEHGKELRGAKSENEQTIT